MKYWTHRRLVMLLTVVRVVAAIIGGYFAYCSYTAIEAKFDGHDETPGHCVIHTMLQKSVQLYLGRASVVDTVGEERDQ